MDTTTEEASAPTGTRRVARDAVRAHVAAVAIDLFAEHGFDAVTIEQIAATTGISPRSFHRYFATKEDVVIGDVTRWTPTLAAAFAARPADEPVWDSLLASYEALAIRDGAYEQHGRRVVRVAASTAPLRARSLEKHLDWARVLAPLVAERLRGTDAPLRAQAIVHASLACFDVGITAWADGGPDGQTAAEALRAAFDAVAAGR